MRARGLGLLMFAALASAAGCGRTRLGCEGDPASCVDSDAGADSDAEPPVVAPTKVDLLFVVDNSYGMDAFQASFAEAAPLLVHRLVNPDCVAGEQRVTLADPTAACPEGLQRELPAVRDLHVGVITTSIGGAGSDSCTPAWPSWDPAQDDRAHLVASLGRYEGAPGYRGLGLISWDPDAQQAPAGSANLEAVLEETRAQVLAAGSNGCGYEASLESTYRFLADPHPSRTSERGPCFDGDTSNGCAIGVGVDEELLEQRRVFLREDSLVLVVMLSNENDCSVPTLNQYWLGLQAIDELGNQVTLPPATAACEKDPNDACCHSCGQSPPAGCPSPAPGCESAHLEEGLDPPNLRCFDQKRRFGVDFLYPVDRYRAALQDRTIGDEFGERLPNPLFSSTSGEGRRPEDVVFAALVGVPWQDIAQPASLTSKGSLAFASASEMQDRWSDLLPTAGRPAGDPLMRESVAARSGQGIRSQDDGFAYPNGYDYDTDGKALQYACLSPLPAPDPCLTTSCECYGISNDPICVDPDTGKTTGDRHSAGAMPGVRQLELLRALGEQGVTASICAKQTVDPAVQSYGYRAAVESIVARAARSLR
ncbi:MAG: hypothetical protein R3B07_11175 [Polyangiaceae bacterium]